MRWPPPPALQLSASVPSAREPAPLEQQERQDQRGDGGARAYEKLQLLASADADQLAQEHRAIGAMWARVFANLVVIACKRQVS
jgi:hypothetical protein